MSSKNVDRIVQLSASFYRGAPTDPVRKDGLRRLNEPLGKEISAWAGQLKKGEIVPQLQYWTTLAVKRDASFLSCPSSRVRHLIDAELK